jgi:hypothetical protein
MSKRETALRMFRDLYLNKISNNSYYLKGNCYMNIRIVEDILKEIPLENLTIPGLIKCYRKIMEEIY